jgi:hypothetical protein
MSGNRKLFINIGEFALDKPRPAGYPVWIRASALAVSQATHQRLCIKRRPAIRLSGDKDKGGIAQGNLLIHY